ncbi:hypothetical protein ADL07_07020 [Streptomyces sp. NRRL F-4707]|nr:hypothetical protein ADL07_07020 [Streptomyces sp. NRRL F-4707]
MLSRDPISPELSSAAARSSAFVRLEYDTLNHAPAAGVALGLGPERLQHLQFHFRQVDEYALYRIEEELHTFFVCHGSRGDDQSPSLAGGLVLSEAKHAAVHDLVSSRCRRRTRGRGVIAAALLASAEDLLLRYSCGDCRVDIVEHPTQGGVLQRFAELLFQTAQFERVHVPLASVAFV